MLRRYYDFNRKPMICQRMACHCSPDSRRGALAPLISFIITRHNGTLHTCFISRLPLKVRGCRARNQQFRRHQNTYDGGALRHGLQVIPAVDVAFAQSRLVSGFIINAAQQFRSQNYLRQASRQARRANATHYANANMPASWDAQTICKN